jgi:hypothetical protein
MLDKILFFYLRAYFRIPALLLAHSATLRATLRIIERVGCTRRRPGWHMSVNC